MNKMLQFQAIDQLNIKTKSFKDLLTDEPYQRSDLIVLQDPSNLSKFNITAFHHVKNDLRVETEGNFYFTLISLLRKVSITYIFSAEEMEFRAEGQMGILKTVSNETKVILNELNRDYKPEVKKKEEEKSKLDKFNAVSVHFAKCN